MLWVIILYISAESMYFRYNISHYHNLKGLSFACTYCAIKQAQMKLEEKIQDFNNNVLISKNLLLSYNQECSTSWVFL